MYGKMQGSRFTEIIPFIGTSAIKQVSCVLTSRASSPWGSPEGVATVWWLLAGRESSPSGVSWGLTGSQKRAAVGKDCDILAYWYGRKISHSSVSSLGPKFNQYLGDISRPIFVPQCWEVHLRASKISYWCAIPDANFWTRPSDR